MTYRERLSYKKNIADNLALAVQTNMMRVATNNIVLYCLVNCRNEKSKNKEESVPKQESITVSRNETWGSVLRKDDIEILKKFHLKTQLEELTHLHQHNQQSAYLARRMRISSTIFDQGKPIQKRYY